MSFAFKATLSGAADLTRRPRSTVVPAALNRVDSVIDALCDRGYDCGCQRRRGFETLHHEQLDGDAVTAKQVVVGRQHHAFSEGAGPGAAEHVAILSHRRCIGD